MPIQKTIEQTYWECEVCHNLYENKKEAEECERIGKAQQELLHRIKNDLRWYHIRHNRTEYWTLGVGRGYHELSQINYTFAKRGSCFRTRYLLQTINKRLIGEFEILDDCSLWEGFEVHGLVPNMCQIKTDWHMIDPDHQKQLRELWNSIEKCVWNECKEFTLGQLYNTTVAFILDNYWCGGNPHRQPQSFSKFMLDNPHTLPEVFK